MFLGRIFVVIVLSTIFLGCQQASEMMSPNEDQAAANKALLARFYSDVFVDWDRDLVDELLSPEFRSHDWPQNARTGPDGFWDFYDGEPGAIHSQILDMLLMT